MRYADRVTMLKPIQQLREQCACVTVGHPAAVLTVLRHEVYQVPATTQLHHDVQVRGRLECVQHLHLQSIVSFQFPFKKII